MTRIVVFLSEKELHQVDELGTLLQVPRDEVIREVIADFLRTDGQTQRQSAFGLWANQSIDGAVFENQNRDEWQ